MTPQLNYFDFHDTEDIFVNCFEHLPNTISNYFDYHDPYHVDLICDLKTGIEIKSSSKRLNYILSFL